jgi:hypothetical protein
MIFSSLVALATASVPYQIEISRAVTTLAVSPPPPIHETRRERPAAEPAGPQILGIGTLDLKAVLPVLRKIVQSGKGYDQFYLELGVARDGSIARCKGEWTPRRQSPLVGEVCAAFEKFSHYKFPAGFVLPAKTGYVGVEFETFNPPSIAPDILPAKKDASTEVHMQIDPTSPFPIERCTQYSRAIPKALAERICAKIVQLPQFNQWQQSNAWAANVKIWLKPAAVPLPREILGAVEIHRELMIAEQR